MPRPLKYGWAIALTALVCLTTALDLAKPGNQATDKLRPLMDRILFYLLSNPAGPSGRTGEIPAGGWPLNLPSRQPVTPAVMEPGASAASQITPAN